ncbi:MAG: glucose sorbosone dehydrogenase [Polyangiaceae bacterium]|jgi:glucose/arabinose dehydrogenase|nr:glucose sorbosone dehydrogenase [Polyangiaceae bacterium]
MNASKTKRWMNVRYTLLAAAAVASLAGGCSDDEDEDDGLGNGARSGSSGSGQAGESESQAGQGGTSNGGTSNGGAAGSLGLGGTGEEPAEGGAAGAEVAGGAAGAGGADDGVDRDAFRPEELPFDEAAFEALSLPEGFSINVYRTGLGQARMLGVHGEHVYVTQPMQGNVVRLIDADEDGVAESQAIVASNLPMVHGIAFSGDQVFLANVHEVHRGTVEANGSFTGLTPIIEDLPDGGQHPLRTLGVGPDSALYISVGSSCDACQESNPEHATILRSTLAGQPAGARTIFAKGLRNTLGFAWHPTTEALWGMDQGSDWRGDDLPPEELNAIQSGKDYGWPYCYANRQVDPVIQDPPGETKEEYCARTTPPVLLNQAHQSPIGFAFYTGDTFPERYQEGAFIALRGSWNRKPATGYRVAFVPYVEGEPQAVEDFVSGFLNEEGTATFGRPAGMAVAPDGALLFTDDTNGIVYRVQAE